MNFKRKYPHRWKRVDEGRKKRRRYQASKHFTYPFRQGDVNLTLEGVNRGY